MVRLVEPSRECANPECPNAGQRQPWSNFYVRTRWPDGGVRTVKSECKTCDKARARRWQRTNPDKIATRNRRAYDRLKADPELWAAHLARIREWQDKPLRVPGCASSERVDAAPFVEWFEGIMERDGTNRTATAERLGLAEKGIRLMQSGDQPTVELATVERALFADGTMTLRELYPSLYQEAT